MVKVDKTVHLILTSVYPRLQKKLILSRVQIQQNNLNFIRNFFHSIADINGLDAMKIFRIVFTIYIF